jgi:hypothetical protein
MACLRDGLLVIDRTATLLDLSIDIPATCYRCGLVALRRDDLLRRYRCDYRIEQLYNDGHHNHRCERCMGWLRLLIKWHDPDDRSREIPDDDE